jgi:hypothetical protein
MIATGTDKLVVDVDVGIARITFNNPEKLNALAIAMRTPLPGVVAALNDDPEVRLRSSRALEARRSSPGLTSASSASTPRRLTRQLLATAPRPRLSKRGATSVSR